MAAVVGSCHLLHVRPIVWIKLSSSLVPKNYGHSDKEQTTRYTDNCDTTQPGTAFGKNRLITPSVCTNFRAIHRPFVIKMVLVFLLAATLAVPSPYSFDKFVSDFDKSYANAEEKAMRESIFQRRWVL